MGGILSPWGLLRQKLCNKTQHSAQVSSYIEKGTLMRRMVQMRSASIELRDHLHRRKDHRISSPPAGLQTARAGVSRQPLPSDFPGP